MDRLSPKAACKCGCNGRPALLNRKVPQQPECSLGSMGPDLDGVRSAGGCKCRWTWFGGRCSLCSA